MARTGTAKTTQRDDDDTSLAELATRVAHALTTKARAALATRGHAAMRASHASALTALGAASSPASPPRTISELAAALGVSQQAASKVVVELEANGYVERQAAGDDRRMTHVGATRAGRDWIAAHRRAHAALEKKIAAATSERSLALVRATLAKALAALD